MQREQGLRHTAGPFCCSLRVCNAGAEGQAALAASRRWGSATTILRVASGPSVGGATVGPA